MPDLTSSPSPGLRALARFPTDVQSAHARFLATGDIDAADHVLLAVVREHLSRDRKLAFEGPLPDESRLVEDLGFDSLAVAEVVFFLEDLYHVRIPQDQLLRIVRIRDLRAFLRARLQAVPV